MNGDGETQLAHAGFILSTGRTSTQNIATIAAKAHPKAIIDHEGLGPNYLSRSVFRRPDKLTAALDANIPLQQKLMSIEDAVENGTHFLEVGWPVYGWLPYLSKRFGGDFRFAHLVRNPFEVAASLTTHGLFSKAAIRPNEFQRLAMIDVSDTAIHHREIAAKGSNFSPFERNLFHWLEVNQFFLEQHHRNGFLGIFRFEELYADAKPTLPTMLAGFLGESKLQLDLPPVDRFQRKLKVEIDSPDPMLVSAAVTLAMRLGYSEEALLNTLDVRELNRRYSRRRLQR